MLSRQLLRQYCIAWAEVSRRCSSNLWSVARETRSAYSPLELYETERIRCHLRASNNRETSALHTISWPALLESRLYAPGIIWKIVSTVEGRVLCYLTFWITTFEISRLRTTLSSLRSGAFPATEYNEVFSRCQRGQVVRRWSWKRWLFSPFNHLTRMIARENYIITLPSA